jgi:hypothetical protein
VKRARASRFSLLGVLVCGLGAISCTHSHGSRNAPGIIDVETRPRTEQDREPRDPGENMLQLGYGAFGGGGVAAGAGSSRGYYAVGPEVSLLYGTTSLSHHHDDFLLTPRTGLGLHLGLNALTSEGTALGAAYGEATLRFYSLLGAGAGWAVDVNDRTSGPQLTLRFGDLYLRMTHQLDTSTSVSLGVALHGQHTWVWSR